METRPKTTKKEEKERQGKTSKGREWFVWFGGEFTLFVLLFLLLCLGLLFWGGEISLGVVDTNVSLWFHAKHTGATKSGHAQQKQEEQKTRK